jgi:excisionase family DNA binding protein
MTGLPNLASRLALRPKEAAETLGIAERTLRKWMKDEGLPFLRVDSVVLIPRDDLLRWVEVRVNCEEKTDSLVDEILEGL